METHAVKPEPTFWTYLGQRPYAEVWELQEEHRKAILQKKAPGHLFLVEHPPTITFGRAEKGENLLLSPESAAERGVDIVETSRGGQITYHGLGQLVAYPVFNIRRCGGVRCFVHGLEECMLRCLEHFGIHGNRKEGFPGAWTGPRKIGSIGIHVRKNVSIHGLALNVCTHLADFAFITPCGLPGVRMTSMEQEGVAVTVKDVIDPFVNAFTDVFGKSLVDHE